LTGSGPTGEAASGDTGLLFSAGNVTVPDQQEPDINVSGMAVFSFDFVITYVIISPWFIN
jgi:hypothetical protein